MRRQPASQPAFFTTAARAGVPAGTTFSPGGNPTMMQQLKKELSQ